MVRVCWNDSKKQFSKYFENLALNQKIDLLLFMIFEFLQNLEHVEKLIQSQLQQDSGKQINQVLIQGLRILFNTKDQLQIFKLKESMQRFFKKILQRVQLTKETQILMKLTPSIFVSKQVQINLVVQQNRLVELRKILKNYKDLSMKKFYLRYANQNIPQKQMKVIMQQKISSLDLTIAEKHKQIEDLKEKLQIQTQANLILLNQQDQFVQKLQTSAQLNSSLQQENIKLQSTITENIRIYQENINSLHQNLRENEDQKKKLISQLQTGYKSYQQIQKNSFQNHQELLRTYQVASNQLQQGRNALQYYQNQLRNSNNKILELNQLIIQKQQMIQNMILQFNQHILEKEQLIQNIRNQSQQNVLIKNQLNLLKIAKQRFQTTIQEHEHRLSSLKQQVDVLKVERMQLERLIQQKSELAKQKQQQNKILLEQLQSTKRQVMNSRNQIKVFKDQYQQIANQIPFKSYKKDDRQVVQIFQNIISTLKQNKIKINQTHAQIKEIKFQMIQHQNKIANLILQNKELSKVIQNRDDFISKLKYQNKKLKEQIQSQIQTRINNDQVSNKVLKQKLTEIQQSKKQNDLLQENINKLSQKLKVENNKFQQISKLFLQQQISNNQLLIQNLQLKQLNGILQHDLNKVRIQLQTQKNERMKILQKKQFFQRKSKILSQQKKKTNKGIKGIQSYLQKNDYKLRNLQGFRTYIEQKVGTNRMSLQVIQKKVKKLQQKEQMQQIFKNPSKKIKFIMNEIYGSKNH